MAINTKHFLFFSLIALLGCSSPSQDPKNHTSGNHGVEESNQNFHGLRSDDTEIETEPRGVLLTGHAAYRLSPVYKVNYTGDRKERYTGSNFYHWTDEAFEDLEGSNWNHNFMPGFAAMYGYNLVNVSHFNNQTGEQIALFDKPVLINTLYYPAFSKDTLNNKPVVRNHYLVSAYTDDSNKDGLINTKDLRRLFYFDIHGKHKTELIPDNYTVLSSEYDPANDFMYVFARLDQNQNGQLEREEPLHVFWIDLNNPEHRGLQYGLNGEK
jgi:hypothetical protein